MTCGVVYRQQMHKLKRSTCLSSLPCETSSLAPKCAPRPLPAIGASQPRLVAVDIQAQSFAVGLPHAGRIYPVKAIDFRWAC